jgi:hypothetical protein
MFLGRMGGHTLRQAKVFREATNYLHLRSSRLLFEQRNKKCSLPRHHAVGTLNTLFMQMGYKDRQLFFDRSVKTDTSCVDLPGSSIGFK